MHQQQKAPTVLLFSLCTFSLRASCFNPPSLPPRLWLTTTLSSFTWCSFHFCSQELRVHRERTLSARSSRAERGYFSVSTISGHLSLWRDAASLRPLRVSQLHVLPFRLYAPRPSVLPIACCNRFAHLTTSLFLMLRNVIGALVQQIKRLSTSNKSYEYMYIYFFMWMTETGVPRASTRASEIIYIFSSKGRTNWRFYWRLAETKQEATPLLPKNKVQIGKRSVCSFIQSLCTSLEFITGGLPQRWLFLLVGDLRSIAYFENNITWKPTTVGNNLKIQYKLQFDSVPMLHHHSAHPKHSCQETLTVIKVCLHHDVEGMSECNRTICKKTASALFPQT